MIYWTAYSNVFLTYNKLQRFEYQSTNQGVGSSNLSGRAIKSMVYEFSHGPSFLRVTSKSPKTCISLYNK